MAEATSRGVEELESFRGFRTALFLDLLDLCPRSTTLGCRKLRKLLAPRRHRILDHSSPLPEIETWFAQIPKVELHLHLEGAIPHAALWELVQKYDATDQVDSIDALADRFRYRDFPHFIETWIWKNQFLREADDFTLIAEAVARSLVEQNVRYAEIFFSAPDFFRHGLTTGALAQAIRRGLDRVDGIIIRLVADLVRDFGPDRGLRTLAEVDESREAGIVGIGIGGSEQDFPASLFAKVFERARELDFHTSAHAGEAAGADSIWQAIDLLKVDRIGHATRACEDPELVAELKRREIPLEMCPISNLCTGIVEQFRDHPVRDFYDRGLRVTINTDDPTMFDTSLVREYQALTSTFEFRPADIRQLILNAANASWQPEQQKRELVDQLLADPSWHPTSPENSR